VENAMKYIFTVIYLKVRVKNPITVLERPIGLEEVEASRF
jgi:hypothetical protein